MKLLLDTHIFLWSLLEPGRLTPAVARVLQDPTNELWLSPIMVWEVLILAEKGRVVLRPEPSTWIRQALSIVPFREAPLTGEVAIQSRHVNLPYQDPVDRFLVATALVYDLTLVTADERILNTRAVRVLPNR
ncbi:MAG: type II toxin-antitoxin system VapC family toxin [Thermoflexus sp.]|jgi:PIN domain nuclease of toxin-antitoxin system|nr:type II toxin-antitoxin system VapC family toxin [Thermoflexus sp.]